MTLGDRPIPGSGGFDLEAIGVLNAEAIAEAGTVLGILIFGLCGLFSVRKIK